MILIKRVGVYLNLVHFKFKQYIATIFQERGVDLTPEQYLILDTLWDEGIISQQQIAILTMKDKNSITKLLDQLERKGMILRISDKSDRRLNLIDLTKKAKELKESVTMIAIESVNRIIDGIPHEDLNTFVSVLIRMGENISDTDTKNI